MTRWTPISLLPALCSALFLLAVPFVWMLSSDHWIRILDDANLIFHEAGHPIYGILGPTLGLYGGTLGQLTFPIVTSIYFYGQREAIAFALCLGWMFENFLNIGRYMSDARSQILPLVGGGEHDWTTIFSRWGLLAHDVRIGHAMEGLGFLGLVGCATWILLHFRQGILKIKSF